MTDIGNIHPGEVLLEDFMKPLELSQNAVARAIDVPPRRINEIVHGRRAITADTAIRLAKLFDTSEQFWMGLQSAYDLEEARENAGNVEKIRRYTFIKTNPGAYVSAAKMTSVKRDSSGQSKLAFKISPSAGSKKGKKKKA